MCLLSSKDTRVHPASVWPHLTEIQLRAEVRSSTSRPGASAEGPGQKKHCSAESTRLAEVTAAPVGGEAGSLAAEGHCEPGL